MRIRHLSLALLMLVVAAAGATIAAQSPNAFGVPSQEVPNPGEAIRAVPGLRAQGWLGQGRSEVLARHGVVATSDPLAAQAGLEILQRGGNAIDAAVATGAVLDATSQNDTGIGGDLFALVWSARDKKLYGLASAGWAPSLWTREFFSGVRRASQALRIRHLQGSVRARRTHRRAGMAARRAAACRPLWQCRGTDARPRVAADVPRQR
jgi:hypothetical protein